MRILTSAVHLLLILAINVPTSIAQTLKNEAWLSKAKDVGRLTFEDGVLYNIEDIGRGLKDMWEASRRSRNEMPKENLGLFTTKGLLVLPNKENSWCSLLGSLKFLNFIINKEQTKVTFKGEELEILGMVHTHPDACSIKQHTPFDNKRFEWRWTTGKVGNYVIATDGIYQAQQDYLTSKWLGFKQEKTYQLIISRYYYSINDLKMAE